MLAMKTKSNGNCAPQKLHLDFPEAIRRSVPMEDMIPEIVGQLTTRVGMIMEDANVIALTMGNLHYMQVQVAEDI